ncbi:MAG TPA: hypothetical protein DIC32_10175 [Acinetobacter radioresistens]|uniref:Pectate lyase superfamily protein domain-containing protein n=1 Tax=Acinetobacter radioresistens TaxID=40216 RepID=A0A3D3G1S9_ACIRA|nr:hypothetical protein [Acinetobacter radioresistens]
MANSINSLRTHVDQQDNNRNSYFENLISRQGVSLQQLDSYYKHLLQGMANIAADKGGLASLVTDASGKSQQEINDSAFRVNAKLLGIVPFLDATAQLEHYLNDSVTHEIYLPKGEYNITRTIVCEAVMPKRIYGEVGATLKTNFTTPQRIFDLSAQVDFKSIIFDFGNNHCSNAIYYRPGFGLEANLSGITFQNLYDRVDSTPTYLVQTQTDVKVNISGITVKNIRKYTNGANPDENGLFSALMLSSNQLSVGRGGTVSDVVGENLANVNSSGVRITGGGVKTVHVFSQGGILPVVINNVSGKDFGRRLVKIQSSGVIAHNISGETDFDDTLTVVASQSDGSWVSTNNKIFNVTAKGKIKHGAVITSTDTTLDGISTDIEAIAQTSQSIHIAKGDNIRVRNITSNAPILMFLGFEQGDIGSVTIEGIKHTPKAQTSYTDIASNPVAGNIKKLTIRDIEVDNSQISTNRSLVGFGALASGEEFILDDLTVTDTKSTARYFIGSLSNWGSVDVGKVSGIPEVEYPNNSDTSDLFVLNSCSAVNIGKFDWRNRYNRGIRINNCSNVTLSKDITFKYSGNVGDIIFTSSNNCSLAPELERFKLVQDAPSTIIRSSGTTAQIPKNGYAGHVYRDTSLGLTMLCTTGAVISNNGTVTTDAVYSLIPRLLQATTVFDPPSIPAGGSESTNVTLTGAAPGSAVLVGFSNFNANIDIIAKVTAWHTVQVTFKNTGTSSVDLGSGTITVKQI